MTIGEIRPFGDRLIVRPDPRPEESAGGLELPELQRDRNPNYYTMTGTVVAVGDGVRFDVWQCQNHQCGYLSRRTAGEYCPRCKATQALAYRGDEREAFDVVVGARVVYGRFAGKQIEVDEANPDRPWWAQTARYLVMREVEVIGVLTGDERVMPGYEEAKWNKPTSGLTPVQSEGRM